MEGRGEEVEENGERRRRRGEERERCYRDHEKDQDERGSKIQTQIQTS